MKRKHLGHFESEQEAHKAYINAAKKYHEGFNNNHTYITLYGEDNDTK